MVARMLGCCLFGVLVVACSPLALTDAGKNVKLLKADPPKACFDIGPVDGTVPESDTGMSREEFSKIKVRNNAAERRADYVRIDRVYEDGTIAGTAFRCP